MKTEPLLQDETEPSPRRKLRTRLFHIFFLLRRPMTLGVRAIVRDKAGRVLLLRHGYVDGWHLPGGGIERRETAIAAVIKEVREETGIRLIEKPILLGVYANRHASPRDHVLLYKCGRWEQAEPFRPNREIAEIGFFALQDLPEGTTRPTRDRLAEAFDGKPVPAFW